MDLVFSDFADPPHSKVSGAHIASYGHDCQVHTEVAGLTNKQVPKPKFHVRVTLLFASFLTKAQNCVQAFGFSMPL